MADVNQHMKAGAMSTPKRNLAVQRNLAGKNKGKNRVFLETEALLTPYNNTFLAFLLANSSSIMTEKSTFLAIGGIQCLTTLN